MTKIVKTNQSGIHPLGHRVLVLPEDVEEISAGGIVLPSDLQAKERMAQIKGTVVALGEGCWLDTTTPNWARVGDRVMIGKYCGNICDGKDGKKYRLISDLDIIARIDNE